MSAVDLWVEPDLVTATFEAASVADRVRAYQADVRVGLPFDDDAFDVIVCVDAWEYFGTDDRLLPSLLRVLRPGGQLGVATVGMVRDVRDLGHIPDHIGGAVGWEALTWHSPERVRQQWELTGLVDVTTARLQERPGGPTGCVGRRSRARTMMQVWTELLRCSRPTPGSCCRSRCSPPASADRTEQPTS